MIVEPGEVHHETVEFILASSVESVLVFSFFGNPNYREIPSQRKDGAPLLSMILSIGTESSHSLIGGLTMASKASPSSKPRPGTPVKTGTGPRTRPPRRPNPTGKPPGSTPKPSS